MCRRTIIKIFSILQLKTNRRSVRQAIKKKCMCTETVIFSIIILFQLLKHWPTISFSFIKPRREQITIDVALRLVECRIATRVALCARVPPFFFRNSTTMQFGTPLQRLRRDCETMWATCLSFLDRRAQGANYLRLVSHVVRSFVAQEGKEGSREFRYKNNGRVPHYFTLRAIVPPEDASRIVMRAAADLANCSRVISTSGRDRGVGFVSPPRTW